MNINIDNSTDTAKVSFDGDIDMIGIKELKDSLFELSSKSSKDIELDLSNATYLDSSGIGMLLTLNKMQKAKGKSLLMVNIPDKIARVLELSSLDMIL
ncbi:MAG: STAS domain-containing protein [Spirochaetes bacterium]|jgi:anti-sigma B factor antagonist|nr:STAS domain-containing protein [Spirochaetota bacterium]